MLVPIFLNEQHTEITSKLKDNHKNEIKHHTFNLKKLNKHLLFYIQTRITAPSKMSLITIRHGCQIIIRPGFGHVVSQNIRGPWTRLRSAVRSKVGLHRTQVDLSPQVEVPYVGQGPNNLKK